MKIKEIKEFRKKNMLELLKSSELTNEEFSSLLNSKKYNLIETFLFDYKNFNNSNFILLEDFINNNLNHSNKMFVSDLIDAAIDFNLELNYEKCLSLLTNYKGNNHYVLQSTIEYIGCNFKFSYVSQIVEKLENIIKNQKCFDSAKVYSAFYLYRITHKNQYLKTILDYKNEHKELILNLLKREANQEKYFEGCNLLKKEL
jgi:hypothetical protein